MAFSTVDEFKIQNPKILDQYEDISKIEACIINADKQIRVDLNKFIPIVWLILDDIQDINTRAVMNMLSQYKTNELAYSLAFGIHGSDEQFSVDWKEWQDRYNYIIKQIRNGDIIIVVSGSNVTGTVAETFDKPIEIFEKSF